MTLITRYSGTVALFGFVAGLASFFLVDRDQEKFAQILSLLMLASWVWLTTENLLHRRVTQWFGVTLPRPILKYLAQLVHQESLFFVIPFFFITTVWNSGQLIFSSLLAIFGFMAIVDPIYYRWLSVKRWLYFIFHCITLFAVLLTALPILFQIPTSISYTYALIIGAILSVLSILRELPFHWFWNTLLALFLVVAIICAGALLRPWVPPASLWLTDVAIALEIDTQNRAPKYELRSISDQRIQQGLYAFTAIHAPRGLHETIYHEWWYSGKLVDKIPLNIQGGRDAGYRAWSHKLNFPSPAQGQWQIRVTTAADQVIGILRFDVNDTVNLGLPITQ